MQGYRITNRSSAPVILDSGRVLGPGEHCWAPALSVRERALVEGRVLRASELELPPDPRATIEREVGAPAARIEPARSTVPDDSGEPGAEGEPGDDDHEDEGD